MKNLLFGILTLGLLFGIAAVAVSPELTDLFVDETKHVTIPQVNESNTEPQSAANPANILKKSGHDWEALSEEGRLAFILQLVKALESKDITVSKPEVLLDRIDTYYEENSKEKKVEEVIMIILNEGWLED
ncbi:hypothetical protein [Pseudalkalibacillus sp. SCS-8]|uniref:hypothetical protein n=1 Tax=Pseudalkalibacillus nanhaiensis TaxID=3115291 RepID=UPI0032DBAF8D